MNAKDKLATGRLMACNKFRYFRTALMALVPRPCEGLGTFGVTDDGVLMYDPKMCEVWTVEEIAAVLIHEISHLLRGHAKRRKKYEARKDFDFETWNKAADFEINDDLVDAKLKLPNFKDKKGAIVGEPCIPATHKPKPFPNGLTAEEYLVLIEKEPKQKQLGGGSGAGEPHVGCGWCGSGAGHALPGEVKGKGTAKGRSEVEIERIKRTVAEEIQKEMARKGQGNVPGGWKRWAEATLKPAKVRWQDKLARVTRGSIAYRAGGVDFHYTRPNRRQAGIGWGVGKPILPAMRAPIPKVAVVQDTSGSMGTAELSMGLPEVDAILRQTGALVDFCACDASVHVLQPVKHWKDLLKLMVGGGGTDFRPAFTALAERRGKPDVVVFITDGYGTFPAKPPPFKVVWLVVGDSHLPPEKFPFGEVVELDGHGEDLYAAA